MAFKYINNSSNSQVRRTFACDECVMEFTMWQDRDAPLPECPSCALKAQAAVTSPAILTTKSQAVDIAQETMEAMGYTDANDNQRVGDIAYKPPSAPSTVEVEAMVRASVEMGREMAAPQLSEAPQVPGGMSQAEMAKNFWGTNIGGPQTPPMAQQTLMGAANVSAGVARREGKDPIAMLHAKKPPMHLDVVASDTGRAGGVSIR